MDYIITGFGCCLIGCVACYILGRVVEAKKHENDFEFGRLTGFYQYADYEYNVTMKDGTNNIRHSDEDEL